MRQSASVPRSIFAASNHRLSFFERVQSTLTSNTDSPPSDTSDHTSDVDDVWPALTRRHRVCFVFSVLIAVAYGLAYWKHRLGVSPFHISKRLPDLDWFVLAVTVVLPLLIGIGCGLLAGRAKWYALWLYPVFVTLSLV